MSSDLETRQVYLFCLIWTRNTFAQNKWFYIVMLSALRDSFFLVPEIVSHLRVIFTNWIMLVQRGGIGRPMGIGSPWPWQKDVEAFVEACQSKFCCYYVVVDGRRSKRIGRDNAGGGRGCTELVSSPYNAQLLFQIELYQFILN